MLLIDDLLKELIVDVPYKISKQVMQEILRKIDKELGNYSSREEVMDELRKLQVSLEMGEISEEDYDEREESLLDALEAFEEIGHYEEH